MLRKCAPCTPTHTHHHLLFADPGAAEERAQLRAQLLAARRERLRGVKWVFAAMVAVLVLMWLLCARRALAPRGAPRSVGGEASRECTTEGLLAWAKERGAVVDGVDVHTFDTGRGLRALRDLPRCAVPPPCRAAARAAWHPHSHVGRCCLSESSAPAPCWRPGRGATMLSVPWESLITVEHLVNWSHPVGALVAEYGRKIPQMDYLALFLLYESANPQRSDCLLLCPQPQTASYSHAAREGTRSQRGRPLSRAVQRKKPLNPAALP
jgi:hypothetical protein